MAVWIHIIGLRKLDSIKNEKNRIQKIINKLNLDNNWELKDNKYFETSISNQSIKIYFDNSDFIHFSGSFELFAYWFRFVDKKNSNITEKIRNIFREFAFKYGISELYYFSEWFYELEENNLDFFNEQIKKLELKKNEFYGLESNEFYVEKINTVANKV